MYCPQCAVQNLDDAKFCRGCGANVSLVPQALQGSLPVKSGANFKDEVEKRAKEKGRKPATVDDGLKNIFQGIGLLIIFLIGIYVFRGAFWLTIWFIIPALSSFGEGIGQLIRVRQERLQLLSHAMHEGGNFRPTLFPPAANLKQFSSPDTAEIVSPPGSVTDATTRHLDSPMKSGAKDA